MLISAVKLDETFKSCLFRDSENTDNHVKVEGVVQNFGFHPERLEASRRQVAWWLLGLPGEFRKSIGGGWSFLQACQDSEGHQWGEHKSIEQLLTLGIGLGLAEIQVPRSMWSTFPGGMPYFVVYDEECLAVYQHQRG